MPHLALKLREYLPIRKREVSEKFREKILKQQRFQVVCVKIVVVRSNTLLFTLYLCNRGWDWVYYLLNT